MPITVTVPYTFDDSTTRNLLCSALEGGSNYWAYIKDYRLPDTITKGDFKKGGRHHTDPNWDHMVHHVPFIEGCAVIIGDQEDKGEEFILDSAALAKGYTTMAEKYPHHMANVMTENMDADTGDCYLQCCLFGQLVYG